MAKWTKCPKCQCEIDVTDQAPGAVIACDGCGAQMRIPGARTKRGPAPQKKAAPKPQPQAPSSGPAPRGRQTALFRKMSGVKAPGSSGRAPSRSRRPLPQKKNNTPLVIGGVFAGVVVLGVLGYLIANKNDKPAPTKKKKTPSEIVLQNPGQPATQEPTPEPEKKKEEPKKKPGLRRESGGGYVPPDSFQGGAEAQAKKDMGDEFVAVEVETAELATFDELASGGKVSEIVKEDYRWMPYIMHRLVSDDESIARSAFSSLRDICKKRNISAKDGQFVNPIDMTLFNAKEYRAGIYNLWGGDWWVRHKHVVASWDPSRPMEYAPIDPKEADWEKIIRKLRQGGGFDDPNEPGGQVIAQLKVMGKPGWIKLASYLDHPELSICRSVAKALNFVTGQEKSLPRANTREAVKEEWEYWLKNLPDK